MVERLTADQQVPGSNPGVPFSSIDAQIVMPFAVAALHVRRSPVLVRSGVHESELVLS